MVCTANTSTKPNTSASERRRTVPLPIVTDLGILAGRPQFGNPTLRWDEGPTGPVWGILSSRDERADDDGERGRTGAVQRGVPGRVFAPPGSAGYDAARIVWNGMIDRRPAIVARCDGADDVVRAIRFGREQHLPIAVRSGGHSIGGFSTCDDGIVIDLSLMRGVRVDPEQRTAQVNGGALLGELDREAQALNTGDIVARRVSFGPRQAPMIVSSGVVASVSARSWAAQRFISWAVRLLALLAAPMGTIHAQVPTLNSARANADTIGIISGGADGTYIRIAADLANVLDGNSLRVLPIIGRGSLQNLRDIMFVRGIDIGIVQMDAREELKAENLHDKAVSSLRYITRLYNEEVHLLANREITDIRQLDGKSVNVDRIGSGTNLTSRLIFGKLGIKPQFTNYDQASAYERLRSGEIQAAVYVAGRPVRAMAEFQSEGRFHLLRIPFEGEIAETYFPARFTNADYPRLVEADKPVETIAVGSILAAFNWPQGSDRYRRLERLVDALFSRFDEFLLPGRHPKWKEVNLAAETPGWERLQAAAEWLNRANSASAPPSDQAKSFQAFVSSRGMSVSAADQEVLFREFLSWERRQQQGTRPRPPRRSRR